MRQNTAERATSSHGSKDGILLLGNYRATLALARELRKRNYHVACGREGCEGGAEYSRYIAHIWNHPPLGGAPAAFFGGLRTYLREHPGIGVVFPVSEEAVRMFAENAHPLPQGVALAMADARIVRRCLDKEAMRRLALECAVPIAPIEAVRSKYALAETAERIGFPLVVRPTVSTRRINGKKAIHCSDRQALRDLLAAWPFDREPLLLQRTVQGKRHNVYFAADRGAITQSLHVVVDRTDSVDGAGLAIEGRTVEPCPRLSLFTQRMLAALGYGGVGCAQYLVDEATGEVCFLEINPRIAGNHEVPEKAGLRLSAVPIDQARGQTSNDVLQGRPGLRFVWTAGALIGVKTALRRGELGPSEAILAAIGSLRAAFRADIHVGWDWRDPLPGIVGLARLLPRFTRWEAGWRLRKAAAPRRPAASRQTAI